MNISLPRLDNERYAPIVVGVGSPRPLWPTQLYNDADIKFSQTYTY